MSVNKKKIEDNKPSLKDVGLKVTNQRKSILELFCSEPHKHYSAHDVYDQLTSNKKNISLATIYRVLTQLEIAGLIEKNQFKSSESSYELKKSHHDHLVCTKCGKIVEFINHDLENLQEKVSSSYKFKLTNHVMTLFGICNSCKNTK